MAQSMVPPLPTPEEQQRAKWDLLLRDLELRAEQVRRIKTFEGWRLLFAGMTTTAVIFAAGGVVGGLLVRLLSGHG